MIMRTLPLYLLAATGPSAQPMQSPGNIRDLSEAVATVNDWRAILLFVVFIAIAQMVGNAWQRFLDRRALDRLGAALDRQSAAVTALTSNTLLHQARVEAYIARADHDGQ